uniref:SET domain-containing protein n=1 Tax=Mastacembelus armatus TaxID=205130 RepID=A0A7N8XK35_9TELE
MWECKKFLVRFVKFKICGAVWLIRKPPLNDAIEHASKGQDKTADLEVKYINSFKGRGVFAKTPFKKGDFVVEYRGELIDSEESQRRRKIYHSRCAVFVFDFYWRERAWCVDAALEDGSLGRVVNDGHKHSNCKMKKVIADGRPHLCLFALGDINAGEEMTYDYRDSDWPWRKQVCNY